ncbi:MAG TPA: hypothetical protein VLC46_03075 [Thermoanaerobaculia bacterium]|jgi:hypothetical protein|nr:hypothetical protein [Thermoanaerobaculia bacterium]
MIEQARAMRQQIPHLVIPTSKGEAQRLSNAASVPPEFVELSAVSVKNSLALVRVGALDPAQTRDLMSYAKAYDPVADELEALAQFIRHSTLAARNKAGSEALTTFAVAKRLAKHPENADLLPFVDDMRRALGRTRKGKSKPAAPDPAPTEPTPETPPETTPSKQ